MSASDQAHQFVVMLGGCCDGARLCHAPMTVELDDGTVVAGIPSEPAAPGSEDEELDSTGVPRTMEFGGTRVELERVRRYSVTRPG